MLDVVAAGVVEPLRIVDHHEVRETAAELIVDPAGIELDVGCDVAALGHRDHLARGALRFGLGDEPVDQGRLADPGRPIEHDHCGQTGDRRRQPSRQLGALRDSPDDVDCHLDLRSRHYATDSAQRLLDYTHIRRVLPEYRGHRSGQ